MGNLFSSSDRRFDEAVDRAIQIRQLRAQIEALKADNNDLRQEMMTMLNGPKTRSRGADRLPSEVSMVQAEAIVEKMLSDPATNLGFVPDMIERPLLRRTIQYLLKSMALGLDTSTFETFGHEVIMRMRPIATIDADDASHPSRSQSTEDASFNADTIPF